MSDDEMEVCEEIPIEARVKPARIPESRIM
jgi:hypothetical protein